MRLPEQIAFALGIVGGIGVILIYLAGYIALFIRCLPVCFKYGKNWFTLGFMLLAVFIVCLPWPVMLIGETGKAFFMQLVRESRGETLDGKK